MKKILVATGFIICIAGNAQKITNKIHFQKGKNLEVTTETSSTSSMEFMGQSMQSSVSSTVTQNFYIKDVSNNNATIDHSNKRILFKADGMGQTISFDSDKPEDMKSDIGKSFQAGLEKKYTMTVDTKGVITSVKVDSTESKSSEDPMLGMLMAQLNIATEAPKAGDATPFKILPEKEINKGMSWIDSSTGESGKRKTVYTVKNISDKEVALDFTEESSLNTTQQVMGFDAKINTNSKGTGQIVLDRQSGLLKEKTSIIDSKQTVEAQGQTLPSNSKMNIKTTVVFQNP